MRLQFFQCKKAFVTAKTVGDCDDTIELWNYSAKIALWKVRFLRV